MEPPQDKGSEQTTPPSETDANHFTHLLLGTSLSLSILSAALSLDPQNKILHVDTNDYYGSYHASLTLSQLVHFLNSKQSSESHIAFPYFQSTSSSSSIPEQLSTLDRHYSLSLSPALQPASSSSPSLDTLIRSNVAKYATFRLLQRTALYSEGTLTTVPSSKEDIFKSTSLSLLDKRKLMKFLQSHSDQEIYDNPDHRSKPFREFLREEFKLSSQLVDAIAYGIAQCQSEQESTEVAMNRVRMHLTSVGRYGNSAHLVAQYGGVGDIVQGYCRASAVKGSTFILGKEVEQLSEIDKQGYSLKLHDIDEDFTVDRVIAEKHILGKVSTSTGNSSTVSNHTPTRTHTLQSIFILDRGINIPEHTPTSSESQQHEPIETAVIIFPPLSLHESHKSTTIALSLGEGTFCCPKGQYVVHTTTSVDQDHNVDLINTIHHAIKDRILHLAKDSPVEWTSDIHTDHSAGTATPLPLFEAYWLQTNDSNGEIITRPALNSSDINTTQPHMATLFDDETAKAERIFYALHGIHSPPYPNPRTKTMRSDDEYRGRGGVGPDFDADEADQHHQREDSTTPQHLFFPLDQDAPGDQNDEE